MKNATVTLLTAAGLMALAGCKSEVMKDRSYQPADPQNDVEYKQPAPMERPPKPVTRVEEEQRGPAKSRRYQPMEGDFSREGIADDAAPRRRSAGKRPGGAAIEKGSAPKGGVYIVKPSDTLGKIAHRCGVSVAALREANKLDPKRDKFLRVGQKLVIPGAAAVSGVKKTAGKAPAPAARPKNAPKLNPDGTYTMVRGDSIPKVARKFGIRAKALQKANNLSDEDTTKLQVGHKLIIPTGADAQVRPVKARTAKKSTTEKAAPAPKAAAGDQPLPPPPAKEGDAALPLPPPPADNTVSGVQTMPPPAENAVENSSFVTVGDAKTLAEFAAKHNTTVEELCRLNPQLDPAAPLESNKLLFVPKK